MSARGTAIARPSPEEGGEGRAVAAIPALRRSSLRVGEHLVQGIEVGEGDLTLVWFPALLDSARSFAPAALALAVRHPGRLRIRAFDPPGYGDLRGSASIPSFDDLEPWIDALLEQLGTRFVLAGNSSGAVMAAAGAAAKGRRVVGMAFVGWCDWRLVGTPHRDLLCPTTAEELDCLMELGWYEPPRLLSATREAQLERSRRADYRAHVASFDPRRFGRHLDAYAGPLALIAGDADRVITPEMVQALARTRTGASLSVLRRCGHYPHRERPEGLVQSLSAWMLRSGLVRHVEVPPTHMESTSRFDARTAGIKELERDDDRDDRCRS